MKESIIIKLNKFNYPYFELDNKLIIELGFNLKCEVHFKENNSIAIDGTLNGWNFLTGILKLNIKRLMFYNSFWLIFLIFVQLYFNSNEIKLPYLPFIFSVWFIMWNLYYLISFYTFKTILHQWTNNVA
jgi:hypothetical protein